jgi:hypothetical protein
MTELIAFGVVAVLIFILLILKKKKSENIDVLDMENNFNYTNTAGKAEVIVNDYGGALAQGVDGIARPISLLKNTKDEIKQAFKDYLVALKNHKKLTNEKYSILSATYGYIDHFVDDNAAAIINKVFKQIENNESIDQESQKVYQEFMAKSFLKMSDKMQELEDIIKSDI